MTDPFVGGGANWFQQQLEAAIQAAMQNLQRQLATGYVSTEPYDFGGQMGKAAMRTQAMNEIYNRRRDIGQHYDEAWGEDVGSPIQRMENWLQITTEEGPKADPIQYAADQGWIDLPEGWGEEGAAGGDGGEGEREATIERLRYESGLTQWEEEFARQERLDEATLQQWEQTFSRQTARDAEDDRRWGAELLRQQGLDDEAIREWEAGHARVLSLDEDARRQWDTEFARQQGLDEQAAEQWAAQHEMALQAQKDARDQWQSEFLRQQGLDEQAQQRWVSEFGQHQSEFNESSRQWNEEFLRQEGLDEEAIRQWNLGWEHSLQLDDEDKRRWNQEFARQSGLDVEAQGRWEREQGFAETAFERTQAWEEEYGKGQLGLDYLTLMSTLRGPQDWVQYANTLRAAQQTPYPEWARKLAEGQGFAPFQAAMTPQQQQMEMLRQMEAERAAQQQGFEQVPGAPQVGQNQLFGGAYANQLGPALEQAAQQLAAEQGMGGQVPGVGGYELGPGPGEGQVGTQPAQALPYGVPGMESPPPGGTPYGAWAQDIYQQIAARPQMVSPEQWANMTPSEQQMLGGAVEGAGGWFPDWYQMMQKAAPTGGGVRGMSWFGGGW